MVLGYVHPLTYKATHLELDHVKIRRVSYGLIIHLVIIRIPNWEYLIGCPATRQALKSQPVNFFEGLCLIHIVPSMVGKN
jgi:hypothetical protein